ncbi:uncharacterized protein LOC121045678 [Ixodes scapularis]|uniref:uncharacterized protein LOC121045678 n=1 Tax=Ixodes scapularis TaxID=6945 RepID=UPI001C3918DC|nr:uncharacterized protein LOC121045678 [Ixodes scapularis]
MVNTYPGAHLEIMFACAIKKLPEEVKVLVDEILNRIPGLKLRELIDLMCKTNRQSGSAMYEEFLSQLEERERELTRTAVNSCLATANKELGYA